MASPQLATSRAAESFFLTTFPRQRLAELIREQSRQRFGRPNEVIQKRRQTSEP